LNCAIGVALPRREYFTQEVSSMQRRHLASVNKLARSRMTLATRVSVAGCILQYVTNNQLQHTFRAFKRPATARRSFQPLAEAAVIIYRPPKAFGWSE